MSSPAPRFEDPGRLAESPAARIVFTLLLTAVLLVSGCGRSTDPTSFEPKLADVDPAAGTEGTLVVLTGKDFQNGVRAAFGGIEAAEVIFVSTTTVLVYVPQGVEAGVVYPVSVTNPGGGADTRVEGFRGSVPFVTKVSGVLRQRGSPGTRVLVEGSAFGDTPGKGRVYFTGGNGRPVEAKVLLGQDWADEAIVAVIPPGAVTGPVWVETPTGRSTAVDFHVDTAP